MDINTVWGIYWTMAWFFGVSMFISSIEELTWSDVGVTLLSSITSTAFMFGIGSKILHHFIG